MLGRTRRISCVAAALMVALSAAPMALADPTSFVAGARALGFEQSDDNIIRMAISACRFLQPNLRRNPEDVEAHIVRSAGLEPASIPDPSSPPVKVPDVHQFLILSVREYCPQLSYRIAG